MRGLARLGIYMVMCVVGLKFHNISRQFNSVAGLTGIIKQSKDVQHCAYGTTQLRFQELRKEKELGGICHHRSMLTTNDDLADTQNTVDQRLQGIASLSGERGLPRCHGIVLKELLIKSWHLTN